MLFLPPQENQIDSKAKLKVELFPMRAEWNKAFRGTLQFPGIIDFKHGVSFFCYTSDSNEEIMHIGFMKPNRRKNFDPEKELKVSDMRHGSLAIRMNSREDSNGNIFYVGEAMGDIQLSGSHGLFFRLFENEEEQTGQLLVAPIDFSKRNHERTEISYEDDYEEQKTG